MAMAMKVGVLGQDHKPMGLGAFDDVDAVAAIDEDGLDFGEIRDQAHQNGVGSNTTLDADRMHDHGEGSSEHHRFLSALHAPL